MIIIGDYILDGQEVVLVYFSLPPKRALQLFGSFGTRGTDLRAASLKVLMVQTAAMKTRRKTSPTILILGDSLAILLVILPGFTFHQTDAAERLQFTLFPFLA